MSFTSSYTVSNSMKKLGLIMIFLLPFSIISTAQKADWSFELHGGFPYNIPAPLIIKQANEDILRLNAQYSSEPMVSPFYWVWRFSRFKNNKSWEFEAMHHKLYLDNLPPEIESFSISHGYNILTVNRSYNKFLLQKYSYTLRFGAGIVLSHPEMTIRDKKLDTSGGLLGWGYYFTGPVFNVALAKRFYIAERLYINTEVKFNPSVSKVPVPDGHAIVWNMPVAFVFGLGIDFIKEKNK